MNNAQAHVSLEQLPIAEMLTVYARKFSKEIDQSFTLEIKSQDFDVRLMCNDYLIKFEQLGLQLSYEPYWEFELLAGRYDCFLYDLQSRFITRNLPGSLVKVRQQTLIDGVSQIPIASAMPTLGNYLGLIDEKTHLITNKTGILFEQQLENIDYAEVACVEYKDTKFVLRNFMRQQSPAVEILSVADTPGQVSFDSLLEVLNLSEKGTK
ncbi:MAG: hypothetical protein JST89_13920 [Cyanobacteria bacterium SZAS-4]|nr:hypothetical protein [Cyanobacteria bacterium SZAS-4]